MSNGLEEALRDAARAFLQAAWTRLQDERVVPLPPHRPYIELARDYFGGSVKGAEYQALQDVITQAHDRFNPSLPLGEREFPSPLIFSFLEAFVAELTASGDEFALDGPSAERPLRNFIRAVQADEFEVACCRRVSHLTTTHGQPIDFDGVRVDPVTAPAHDHNRELNRIMSEVICDATSVYDRGELGDYAPPESVITALDSAADAHALGSRLSARIEQFLMAVRLLKLGTSESMFEVQGGTSSVHPARTRLVRFRGAGPGFASPTQLAERVITLEPEDVGRVTGLERLISEAQGTGGETGITSLQVALGKFHASYHAYGWDEQIVDLATALEATLSGQQKEDVTLRLKMRAATLLYTESDSASDIFKDISRIYGVRSTLVHGNAIARKSLLKEVRKITTVPNTGMAGIDLAHGVERLRDLVRRSLLARVCLAQGDHALWPIGDDDAVDVAMVDDRKRRAWRDAWRGELQRIDALAASERPDQQSDDADADQA